MEGDPPVEFRDLRLGVAAPCDQAVEPVDDRLHHKRPGRSCISTTPRSWSRAARRSCGQGIIHDRGRDAVTLGERRRAQRVRSVWRSGVVHSQARQAPVWRATSAASARAKSAGDSLRFGLRVRRPQLHRRDRSGSGLRRCAGCRSWRSGSLRCAGVDARAARQARPSCRRT